MYKIFLQLHNLSMQKIKELRRHYIIQKTVLTIFLLFHTPFLSQGQISLSFPVSRAVIQRDNANRASLNIAGHIKMPLIELKLV